jgi:ABC-type transporter Mla MlaB component
MTEPLKNVNQPSIVQLDVISDSARELVPLITPPVAVEAFALLLLIGFLARFAIVQLLVSGVNILVGVNVLHVVSLMSMSGVMRPESSCLVLLMFVVVLKRPRVSLVLSSLALWIAK